MIDDEAILKEDWDEAEIELVGRDWDRRELAVLEKLEWRTWFGEDERREFEEDLKRTYGLPRECRRLRWRGR